MDNFYTVAEVAGQLDVTQQKVYYEIDHGRLNCQMIANRKVIMKEEVDALRDRLARENNLMTPGEYCEDRLITRSQFDYRVSVGKITTIKIGGKVFVTEEEA